MKTLLAVPVAVSMLAMGACSSNPGQPVGGENASAASASMAVPAAMAPGDMLTYAYTRNGTQPEQMTERIVQIVGDSIEIDASTSRGTYPTILDRETLAVKQGMCLSNGQRCSFTPAIVWLRQPLAVGQEWKTEFDVAGETFDAHVKQTWRVAKVERVSVKGGEFETYKLTASGAVTGKTKAGETFTGTESATCWSAPSAKMFCVKYVYKNSFGEKSAREVTSLALK